MENITLNIAGMTCQGCSRSVENVLGALNGVAEVHADWQAGTANVRYDASRVSLPALHEAVENAGFDIV